MADGPAPDVLLQVAIAARKLDGVEALELLYRVLTMAGDDKLIPHIVWQNLHPLLEKESERFLALVKRTPLSRQPNVAALMPRVIECVLGRPDADLRHVAAFVEIVSLGEDAVPALASTCLAMLAGKVHNHEIARERLEGLRAALEPIVAVLRDNPNSPLRFEAALLAAAWQDAGAVEIVREVLLSPGEPEERRLQALGALVAAGDIDLLDEAARLLSDQRGSVAFRRRVLDALGRAEAPGIASTVLAVYPGLEPELKPQAIELLTGRAAWSKSLLAAVAEKRVAADALNLNQVRKLLAGKDAELAEMVRATWGTVRSERNPQREQVIAQMRTLLRQTTGDAYRGRLVFKKVCGQCHKIYGEGQEVGPDITVNGRSSFEQLLSNVFDPSLVIGAAYQARTVSTTDGRVITGLLAEDNDQRVVLKVQGGKLETIARGDIDEMETSRLSLMPENLEQQLKPEELADLFAFLALDRPPADPAGRRLPDAP
jgi:putative heme-binding domain-containing protein